MDEKRLQGQDPARISAIFERGIGTIGGVE